MTTGNCRFLYDNIIDSSATLTASSVKTGVLLQPVKEGTGSATLTPAGSYTGQNALEYIVEIDSVSGGTEVGQSTYRWKTSADSAWTASTIVTSSTAATLSNGVTIKFTSGTGADFALGDAWYFKAINRFSPAKIYDYDRSTRYRSLISSSAVSIQIVLLTPSPATALVIYDHNLTQSATVQITGNTYPPVGDPPFNETVTWNQGKILHYFASEQTYQSWSVLINDTSNPDGYIEIGNIFIGNYFEPSRTFKTEHQRNVSFNVTEARNRYNVARKRFHGKQESFTGSLSMLVDADITSFETMLDTIGDTTSERLIPVYFNHDSGDTSDFYMMEWEGLQHSIVAKNGSTVYHDVALSMTEVAKSLD